MYTMMKKYFHQ